MVIYIESVNLDGKSRYSSKEISAHYFSDGYGKAYSSLKIAFKGIARQSLKNSSEKIYHDIFVNSKIISIFVVRALI